jgi:hypothetical protein
MDRGRTIRAMRCHRLIMRAILALCLTSPAFAFDNQDTHPRLTSAAVDLSKLNATLMNRYRTPFGS